MTTIPNAQGAVTCPRPQGCPASGNITRILLGYLDLAGPFYVAVSLAQALARPGFSLARDEWSLLALGPLGWIQMVNHPHRRDDGGRRHRCPPLPGPASPRERLGSRLLAGGAACAVSHRGYPHLLPD
jgi:hypothetical protein